jgi:glycosyltransferase involved in cell wall biosynthesis
MTPTTILAFTRYSALGASSRMRLHQYLPSLNAAGFHVEISALLGDKYLRSLYLGRKSLLSVIQGYATRLSKVLSLCLRRSRPNCVWIEKELWPWAPAWLELGFLAGHPYVLDLDDATFHFYDTHRLKLLRMWFGRKIDRLMRHASVVTVGSPYLAERAAAAAAKDIRVIPTTVELERYSAKPQTGGATSTEVVIGWIGTPATVHYLQVVLSALRRLAATHPIRVKVVGGRIAPVDGVSVECVAWTEESEAAEIAKMDIGIMPLIDSPWERGKCGYKLIQYMACGLPVVASPVGVNTIIVTPGLNGELADDELQWVAALSRLVTEPVLRAAYGRSGRELVERRYCTNATAPAVLSSLRDAVVRTDPRVTTKSKQE